MEHWSLAGIAQLVKRLSYGLDGPGDRIPFERGDFPHLSRPPLGPIQPPTHCVPGITRGGGGGKVNGAWYWPPTHIYGRGWRKSRAIHLFSLWTFVACYTENFTLYLRNIGVMILTGENRNIWKKKFSQGSFVQLTWDRTWVSALRSRYLNSWDMARRKTRIISIKFARIKFLPHSKHTACIINKTSTCYLEKNICLL
jgi:hypothetical protein